MVLTVDNQTQEGASGAREAGPFDGADLQDQAAGALDKMRQAQRLMAEAVVDLIDVDASGLHHLLGYVSTERMVAHSVGVSNQDSRRLVRLARHLSRFPATAAALADGEITADQADILARAAAGSDEAYAEVEEQWLAACLGRDINELQRLARQWRAAIDRERTATDAEHTFNNRGLWFQQGFDGSSTGRFRLDPIGTELVRSALETQPDPISMTEPRTAAQRRADKLVDLCAESTGTNDPARPEPAGPSPESDPQAESAPDTTSEHAPEADSQAASDPDSASDADHSTPPTPKPASTWCSCGLGLAGSGFVGGGLRVNVDVIIDLATLAGEEATLTDLERLRCELAHGAPIAGPGLDRLLCDASYRALITDGPRQVLAYNRATPTISNSLRRALRARDRGCQFHGCDRPWNWCDAHHLVPRHRGGPTNLENLALLCRYHHTCVHEGGWQLTRAPDGTIVTTSP